MSGILLDTTKYPSFQKLPRFVGFLYKNTYPDHLPPLDLFTRGKDYLSMRKLCKQKATRISIPINNLPNDPFALLLWAKYLYISRAELAKTHEFAHVFDGVFRRIAYRLLPK